MSRRYKVVMIGDTGVGKTSVVNRMRENVFSPAHVPTIGSQFVSISLSIEGQKVMLETWDTAGQEIYRSLVGFYTREARGAILVFDVTLKNSFESLQEWIKFITNESPSVKILLFANKVDLVDNRVVSTDAIKKFAAANNLELIEGSAKSGQGVAEAFGRIGEVLLESGPVDAPEAQSLIEVRDPKKKSCC